MRILQVHQINQVAYTYGEDLERRGHYVEVYEPSLVGGLAPLPVKMAFMPWRVLDMRHVVGKLNRSHFDIVHIHWASYGVLGLASRIPYIVHCHGGDVRHRLQHPLSRVMSELQAMSCARPVIASFRYDDAYPTPPPICQAATAEEVDERLEYLFRNPEMVMSLGRQAREWIIENHDHRVLAGKLEELYQSILLEK